MTVSSVSFILTSKKSITYKNRRPEYGTRQAHNQGQITIPIEIRKKLNVGAGDKVVFLEENGRIFIENAEKLKFAPDEHSGGKS